MKIPKVIVVMPAHNAAKTLVSSYRRLPKSLIDEIILVDDGSTDKTYEVAKKLPIHVYRNPINLGYGGNLKVCLHKALEHGADFIIEFHPDNQYDPKDLPLFIQKAKEGYDFALGSRFVHPKEALDRKMPLVKFVANRALSFIDEFVLGLELSEFHSGFRLYTKRLLETVSYKQNSDNYLFSFEIIVQAVYNRLRIGEVPISCDYHPQMHTANLKHSTIYALGTFKTLTQYLVSKFWRIPIGPFRHIKSPSCPLCMKSLSSYCSRIVDPVSDKHFTVWFCTPCQIGFTQPLPSLLRPFYPDTYYSRVKTFLYKALQKRRVHLLKKLIRKKGAVLDIGCGDGWIGQQLIPYGVGYTGIEATFAQERNTHIKYVGIEGLSERPKTYSVVTFWQTLEHLADPVAAITKTAKTLRSRGYLIIECPNYNSWERQIFRWNWFHYDPPRHLFHFTNKGLRSILERQGFTVLSQRNIYALEYIPYGLAQSLLYTFAPSLSVFSQKKGSKVTLSLIGSLSIFLAILTIPITYFLYLIGNTPISLTIAQKRPLR